jgi:hypothetical protein
MAAKATDKKTAKAAPAAAKTASKLTPDAKGNYPLQLYSVKQKAFVDLAKKPSPVLTTTGRGAFMCKGQDTEGNSLAMIVSKVVAANWVERNLATYAEGSEPEA